MKENTFISLLVLLYIFICSMAQNSSLLYTENPLTFTDSRIKPFYASPNPAEDTIHVVSVNGDIGQIDFAAQQYVSYYKMTQKLIMQASMLLQPANAPNNEYLLLGADIGMIVFDVTIQGSIVQISQNSTLSATGFQVFDQGRKLIVSMKAQIIIFDITQFPQLVQLALISDASTALNSRCEVSPDMRFVFWPAQKINLGYYVYDISNFSNINLAYHGLDTGNGIYVMAVHPTQKIYYVLNKWDILQSVNYTSFYSSKYPLSTIAVLGTYVDTKYADKNDMRLSYDNAFLLVAERGFGILLISVIDPTNLYLYQLVISVDYSEWIIQTGNYLYYTNLQSVNVYNQVNLTSFASLPNLFTTAQSFQWKNNGTVIWPWDAVIMNNMVWVAYVTEGLYIFSLTNNSGNTDPKLLTIYTGVASVKTINFDQTHPNILYIQNDNYGLYVVNFTNIFSPKIISQLAISGTNRNIVVLKRASVLIASTTTQLAFVNNSNPALLSQFYSISIPQKSYMALSIHNETVLIAVLYNYGIQIFNITNLTNAVQLSSTFVYGATQADATADSKTLFVANGVLGIAVYDITNLISPALINTVNVSGQLWYLKVSLDQQHLFAAVSAGIQLTCFQITDSTNLGVIGAFNVNPKDGAVFLKEFSNTIILLSYQGVYIIPTTVPLQMNTEMFIGLQNDFTLSTTYSPIALDRVLNVGEQIKIIYAPLIDPFDKIIDNVYVYSQGQLTELPSWITFSQIASTLMMTVSQEGVGTYVVVLQIKIRVYATDFPAANGTAVYNALQQGDYIDENGFLIQDINFNLELSLDDPTLVAQSNYIRDILRNKIYQIPQTIQIQSSLAINVAQEQNFITSLSTQAQVQLQVDPQFGVFIDYSPPGVSTSFNTDQSQIIMSGSLALVNKNLQTVRYNANSGFCEGIQVLISLDDSLNSPQVLSYNMSQIAFLKQNFKPIVQNPIQKQIDSLNKDGKIYIVEEFNFQLASNTFLDKDDTDSLSLFIFQDGMWVVPDSELWLQFYASSGSFKGTPTQDLFRNVYRFKVVASDGYASTEDFFTIECSLIPFSLVITYLAQIGGPIASAIGLYSYRIQIYNIFTRRKYAYPKQFVRIGEQFNCVYCMSAKLKRRADKVLKLASKTVKEIINGKTLYSKDEFTKIIKDCIEQNNIIDYEALTPVEQAQSLDALLYYSLGNVYKQLAESSSLHRLIYARFCHNSQIQFNTGNARQWWQKMVEYDWDEKLYLPVISVKKQQFFAMIDEIALADDIRMLLQKQNTERLPSQNIQKSLVLQNGEISAEELNLYVSESHINKELLEHCLEYDAMLDLCIDVEQVKLQAVKGYRIQKNMYFQSLMTVLGADLVDFEMNGNRQLPVWLDCEVKNEKLHIYGMPRPEHQGDFSIIANDYKGVHVWEMHITVLLGSAKSDEVESNAEYATSQHLQINSNLKMDQMDATGNPSNMVMRKKNIFNVSVNAIKKIQLLNKHIAEKNEDDLYSNSNSDRSKQSDYDNKQNGFKSIKQTSIQMDQHEGKAQLEDLVSERISLPISNLKTLNCQSTDQPLIFPREDILQQTEMNENRKQEEDNILKLQALLKPLEYHSEQQSKLEFTELTRKIKKLPALGLKKQKNSSAQELEMSEKSQNLLSNQNDKQLEQQQIISPSSQHLLDNYIFQYQCEDIKPTQIQSEQLSQSLPPIDED